MTIAFTILISLIVFACVPSTAHTQRTGFYGDLCHSDLNCRGSRTCGRAGAKPCAPGDVSCICFLYFALHCNSSTTCEPGETCVKFPQLRPFCASCSAMRTHESENGIPVDGLSQCPPLLTNGATGVACNSSITCNPPRRCLQASTLQLCDGKPENDKTGCVCRTTNLTKCSGCSPCDDGEACLVRSGEQPTCLSVELAKADSRYSNVTCTTSPPPTTKPTPSTSTSASTSSSSSSSDNASTDAVCVGVDALSHLPRTSLVFRHDIWSKVLCDVSGSCATGGHIVVFQGHAMTMRRYCRTTMNAGCVEMMMWVNSPRMIRRQVRISAKTKGMEFTALAARYESVIEEAVLRMLVRARFA